MSSPKFARDQRLVAIARARAALLTPLACIAFGCSSSDETAGPPATPPTEAGDPDSSLPDADSGSDAADVFNQPEASPVGQRCDDTAPCPDGYVCEEGVCRVDCGLHARCDGEVCCDSGQVCYLGECTAPGTACTDPSQVSCVVRRCPAGQQCDPTIGNCMPVPAVQCEYQPVPSFDPQVYWHWDGASAYAGFGHVIATPAVADLDGDGASDIVVPVTDFLPGGFDNDGGIVCALSGIGDCAGAPVELWCTDPADVRVSAVVSPAVADLEGTGELTIIVGAIRPGPSGNAYGIVAYDAAGQRIPDFGTDGQGNPVDVYNGVGAPAVADLDHDGKAEVIFGYSVFDSSGILLWQAPGAVGNVAFGPMSVVADLDGDGDPEVIGGNAAFHGDGTPAWAAVADATQLADGWPGIADFDIDGSPEVVVVSGGQVRVFDAQGNRYSAADAAIQGAGGPPTIADVDGDGRPDIAVAGSNSLTVFSVGDAPDHALVQLWQMPSRDFSSNFTGSSVFDFEGDGSAEVIYGDECYARVYDGQGDGNGATTVRFEVPNTSCTGTEYPVVVDVTGDGKAEFVVVANDFSNSASACAPYVQQCVTAYPGYTPTHGVTVYRDANDNWVSTRAIWNQHSYHVTNVCDGLDEVCPAAENVQGRVPSAEHSSWEFPAGAPLDSYRVNARIGNVFSAPDLVPRNPRADLSQCPAAMRLLVEVTNLGAIGVPAGVAVAFFRGSADGGTTTLLGVEHTQTVLLPGASELVAFDWSPLPADAQGAPVPITIAVDDDGTGKGSVNECDEANNIAEIVPQCQGVH